MAASLFKTFVVFTALNVLSSANAAPALVSNHQSSRAASANNTGFSIKQNALDAQKQNLQFATLSVNESCNAGQQACVNSSFAQCVDSKWELTPCSSGTLCVALPLLKKAGTSVACDTPADASLRFQNAGVQGGTTGQGANTTTKLKVKRQYGNPTTTPSVGSTATPSDAPPYSYGPSTAAVNASALPTTNNATSTLPTGLPTTSVLGSSPSNTPSATSAPTNPTSAPPVVTTTGTDGVVTVVSTVYITLTAGATPTNATTVPVATGTGLTTPLTASSASVTGLLASGANAAPTSVPPAVTTINLNSPSATPNPTGTGIPTTLPTPASFTNATPTPTTSSPFKFVSAGNGY